MKSSVEKFEIMKSSLVFVQENGDDLSLSEVIECIDIILSSSEEDLLDMYKSYSSNYPDYRDYYKDQFICKLISEFCEEIFI
jgi:hypothetical protein